MRLPREADRHIGRIEAQQQPAHDVDAVPRGHGERLDRPVVGQERLLRDRGLEPGPRDHALQREDTQPHGDRGKGPEPVALLPPREGQARERQPEREREPLRPREREQRTRHDEAARRAAGREREPALEQQECEEQEERDVRAVEIAPDHGARERDEGAASRPSRGPARRAPMRTASGSEAGRARRPAGSRTRRAPRPERRRRARAPARPCGAGSWPPWSAPRPGCSGRVALGHRPRVLRDDVEVAHLRDEVAAGGPQHEADEERGREQPDQEERAHGQRS